MAIEKEYTLNLEISYKNKDEKGKEDYDRWFSNSTFRVSTDNLSKYLQVEAFCPNIGLQEYNQIITEMLNLLNEAKSKLEGYAGKTK